MSKENFKSFARIHPELANFVDNNQTNWQKLYELYDIYGENSSVWDKYFSSANLSLPTSTKNLNNATVGDFVNSFKNMDLETVQKGIANIQKTIGILQDMGLGKEEVVKAPYEPRPMYKYFED